MEISVGDLLTRAGAACAAAERYVLAARQACRHRIAGGDARALDIEQRALHGFSWIATLVQSLEAARQWAARLQAGDGLAPIDALVLRIGFGEYLAQLVYALPMSQNELARPTDLGIADAARALADDAAAAWFLVEGNNAATRAALTALIEADARPSEALGDETLDMIRAQFRAFAAQRIAPKAHDWHLADALIPIEIVDEMADLGVFGICIDAEYGGLGLGKLAMCVVSEELSRGWICAGSLGTRSEIAGELIGESGTPAQKAYWLPRLARGETLPTAVFTEPDVGSDLASLKTRAVRDGDGWSVTGAKNWITHAARADLMTLLVRTNPAEPGHAGLSMLLAAKTRGTEEDAFPDEGLAGSEIEVLGYRGMREYALSFDGFRVPGDAILGGEEGKGFRQLMRTFEGARIQTAARAIGVGWNAFDVALDYARTRRQFGCALADFPRVADKLALMLVELVMARELTYAAARRKDEGRRCDIEAGMAKLLAARVAWANADATVQIHGGNGYALEYQASRILCDARILNIFEGAAEIQAHVVARGLLSAAN
ncbi:MULTISPECIES: acyl-CoA dehydrogenase family protein [unclassified Sphingomonas]|uniref:acyl-CoA dehydrogenase family protein n=1 Tax=unclassified Sphingomonas TaxID=196159 RepID=UPI00092A81AB|nr:MULTISPECIES: acyl-CoA dehydrogenase family protein [unclassified Sphingomonas]OJU20004.1 MAG: acyl-CoA dehydrogenase [Sphingomonas sp. 66-10]